MRVDYRYPAVVQGTPRHRRSPRDVLTLLSSSVDIPEIAAEDAPVACAVEWETRAFEYRHRDGKFYRAVSGRQAFEAGVCFRVMTELAAALPPRKGVIDPVGAETIMRTFPSHLQRLTHSLQPYQQLGWIDPDSSMVCRMEALADVDIGQAERSTELAAEYASEAFLLEGEVWMSVPEPHFRLSRGHGIPSATLGTLDIYAGERFAWMEDTHRLIRKRHVDCAYWNWHEKLYSFLEVDEFEAAVSVRLQSSVRYKGALDDIASVRIETPEMFGVGHAEQELVRQARLAVSRGRVEMLMGPGWRMWELRVPTDLRAAYRRLERAVKDVAATGAAVGRGLEPLADVLETYAESWTEASRRADFPDHMLGETGHDIARAVARWRGCPLARAPHIAGAERQAASDRDAAMMIGFRCQAVGLAKAPEGRCLSDVETFEVQLPRLAPRARTPDRSFRPGDRPWSSSCERTDPSMRRSLRSARPASPSSPSL